MEKEPIPEGKQVQCHAPMYKTKKDFSWHIYMPSYAQILMNVINDCFDNYADIFSLGKILFFTRYNRLLRCWLVQKLLVTEIRSTEYICLHQQISGTLHINFIFEHFYCVYCNMSPFLSFRCVNIFYCCLYYFHPTL